MEKEIKIRYQEYENEIHLSDQDALLLAQAKEAAKEAYAPYSKFNVGAAVLLESGRIILGNNQENSAFPTGLCAERVALFAAHANYPEESIHAIAVTAFSSIKDVNEAIPPCGSCLQVLCEYQNLSTQKIRIILQGKKGKVLIFEGVENLLPFGFQEHFV